MEVCASSRLQSPDKIMGIGIFRFKKQKQQCLKMFVVQILLLGR